MGYCQGGWAFNILNGAYDGASLDGLRVAYFAAWPGQIHEGRGTAGLYIDQRATEEQRRALLEIFTGKAGGMPWAIFGATVDTWLEPKYVDFEWKFVGKHSSFRAGPHVHLTMESMTNPVTGAELAGKIQLTTGLVWKEAEMASSKAFAVVDKGMRYAHPGKYSAAGVVEHPTG
jgi:hypothetical protein